MPFVQVCMYVAMLTQFVAIMSNCRNCKFPKNRFFQFLFFPTKASYFDPTLVALAALYLQIFNSSNGRILILIDLLFWLTAVSAT